MLHKLMSSLTLCVIIVLLHGSCCGVVPFHITRGARQVQRSVGRDSEESEVTATYDCVL